MFLRNIPAAAPFASQPPAAQPAQPAAKPTTPSGGKKAAPPPPDDDPFMVPDGHKAVLKPHMVPTHVVQVGGCGMLAALGAE